MHSSIDLLQSQCSVRSIGAANLAMTSLLQALLTSYCNISSDSLDWPPDYGPYYLKKGHEIFDFIVVGGGTAGSVVAGRLSDNPNYRVLLIEAGDNPPIESDIPGLQASLYGSKFDWYYSTKPNNKSCLSFPGAFCAWPRGKMLGGSSALNALIMIRGNRRDYDNWKKLGNPTWDWDSVLPYFKKTENYIPPNPDSNHGIGGPMIVDRFKLLPDVKQMIIQAAQEGGYSHVDDFRDGHFLGYGQLDGLVVNGIRNTPAKAFLRTNEKPNLLIIKNAIVSKINFDANGRAVSVNFTYRDKKNKNHKRVAKSSKEIVVSAGTVESPKLLMLSGIGPRKHLKSFNIPVKCNLAVGKNLQDHVAVHLFFEYDTPTSENPLHSAFDYLMHRKGSWAGNNLLDLSAFLDIRNETGLYPNMQVHHILFQKGSSTAGFTISSSIEATVARTLRRTSVLGMYMILLNPKSRGNIKLQSGDYRQQPTIYPNYFCHNDDIKLYIATIRTLLKLQNTPTFRENGIKHLHVDIPACKAFARGSDEYWRCYIMQTNYILYHPVGTVKMGPDSDPKAVVDYKLRVRGVKGLRVADCSIMPKIVSANTMAAAIMIGEKVSDFIKDDWKS